MPAEVDQNSIGVVLAAEGEVFLRSESGIRQVESGAEVFRGEELVTGAGSTAEIRFVDDTLLSQGADSVISLDDYVFDDSASDAELLFKMSQGTFRLVTGKIAEQNPDRFQVGTPLATIGIRGTTIVSEITPGGGQKIGVEEIHAGKALLVQSISGEIRMISNARELVDIAMSGQLGSVRPMTARELSSFREIAPSAIRQEQEIQQQRQEEQQQDDPQDQNPDDQGQEAQGEDGDPQGDSEGGETGGPAIPGQGVLDPGIGVIDPAGALAAHQTGLQTAIEAGAILGGDVPVAVIQGELQQLAGQIFGALETGNLAAAQHLLHNLQSLAEDLIDDLINPEVPPEAEGQTVTDSDGNNWIYGTSGDDSWVGTDAVDYYDGLAGNDYISGQEANDVLHGNTGNDTIYGNCGNDTISGGAGDDTISGGHGLDTITGGDGIDILSFEDASAGVDAYISAGTAVSDGETDFFVGIEALKGSSYNDTLSGNMAAPTTFYGSSGSDVLTGFSGQENWASYAEGSNGVSVKLDSSSDNLTKLGTSDKDTLHEINHFIGTNSADTITGNAASNTLMGGQGDDTLTGGEASDHLYGGAGNDVFNYTTTAPSEGGDTVYGFESGVDKFYFSGNGGFNSTWTFGTVNGYDGSTGTGAGAQFIYDTSDKELYYDADGSGSSSSGVLIATLDADSDAISAVDNTNPGDIAVYV
ncbi:FecR domain-containing protein [Desulfovibrio sp. JC022]|uniref:FecR domain-containing protein n=1 Tax=Desulfovibrio sp. JC022 TaxID=2593642 RepID=UPI0013CF8C63|nr:FecR domain-containing protein [Desulfovibrio sp. JC022]NDV21244.1 hypothetical protein [Desulfovibrio sp. JC022]